MCIIRPFSEYSDQDLLEQLKSSNSKALEALYELYYVQLCQIAFRKLGDEALVEELVQDVFLNLWIKRKELDANGSLFAYLYATLRNRALHEIRARIIKERHYLHIAELGKGHLPDPEDDYVAKETELKVMKVIESLPAQCREAFRLSREEQLSYKAIAARMNISVNTVEKHIGKALKILKRELKDYDAPVITIIGLLALYKL
ncbi:RNA polymerase sigma-70 factor [Pedobacter hiemivivus]|uniref:RNA polymerase sigma-70 factor n=1 Tax=Pedobacter hiemivivus TaxID=2530454 RepID=A0A4R0N8P2_9SPHI|nr:RNA polymerase sigma-70 factor [Pedobacter hiemivivus]